MRRWKPALERLERLAAETSSRACAACIAPAMSSMPSIARAYGPEVTLRLLSAYAAAIPVGPYWVTKLTSATGRRAAHPTLNLTAASDRRSFITGERRAERRRDVCRQLKTNGARGPSK